MYARSSAKAPVPVAHTPSGSLGKCSTTCASAVKWMMVKCDKWLHETHEEGRWDADKLAWAGTQCYEHLHREVPSSCGRATSVSKCAGISYAKVWGYAIWIPSSAPSWRA